MRPPLLIPYDIIIIFEFQIRNLAVGRTYGHKRLFGVNGLHLCAG